MYAIKLLIAKLGMNRLKTIPLSNTPFLLALPSQALTMSSETAGLPIAVPILMYAIT